MISDHETSKVYFSNQSTYSFNEELTSLKKILDDCGISWSKVLGTRDYFCRDYMPIQVDKAKLVRFKFKPDYLLNDPEQCMFVTDTNLVFRKNDFLKNYQVIASDIILDGGNLVKCKSKVIITDKVFIDNPNVDECELIKQLESLLGVKVIIVPRYPDEPTGHSDGLVRFIDENTVLTINLDDEIQPWKDNFLKALNDAGLEVVTLPQLPHESEDNWAYINFLQVKVLIIVPSLHNANDKVIQEFYIQTFPAFKIRMLEAKRILTNGGGLNCFTWNVCCA